MHQAGGGRDLGRRARRWLRGGLSCHARVALEARASACRDQPGPDPRFGRHAAPAAPGRRGDRARDGAVGPAAHGAPAGRFGPVRARGRIRPGRCGLRRRHAAGRSRHTARARPRARRRAGALAGRGRPRQAQCPPAPAAGLCRGARCDCCHRAAFRAGPGRERRAVPRPGAEPPGARCATSSRSSARRSSCRPASRARPARCIPSP